MTEPGETFNWVKARHECSVVAVFERLKLGAGADVDERNRLGTSSERPLKEFQVRSANGDRFVVFQDTSPPRSVAFVLSGRQICVTSDSPPINFAGVVTLNDEGECRLKVGDDELEEWQVLKRALETLFFGDGA
jgi:hypothetical protein